MTSSQAELAQIKAEEVIAKKNEAVLRKRALEELEKKEDQVKDYFEEYKPHSQGDKRFNALGDAAKPSSSLKHEINKINALDKLKERQEKKLNLHNRQVKVFEELAIDFMVKHDIQNCSRSLVLSNRKEYAGFYILAVIEMLKYAVKEDYENSKTEIQLIPIQFEYIKPNTQAK